MEVVFRGGQISKITKIRALGSKCDPSLQDGLPGTQNTQKSLKNEGRDYLFFRKILASYILYHPPPCRQARQGVFEASSGGLMSGICVFLRDPQPVTCATRFLFFEHFFGSYFLMIFWSPMIPQSVQVGLHVGSFLESCCLTFPIFSGVYLGS